MYSVFFFYGIVQYLGDGWLVKKSQISVNIVVEWPFILKIMGLLMFQFWWKL